MIDLGTLTAYVLIVLGFVFIPGPATLLTVVRATASGARVGIATGMGIAMGDLIHTITAIIGISAVIAASATLFSALKYLGAAYLLYLGIRALIEKEPVALASGSPVLSAGAALRQGLLTEVLNPKTALFFLAFLPQFVRPENGAVSLQMAVLGGIFILLGLVSTIAFALGAGRLGQFLRRRPAVLKWQGKVVGGIYCALGIRLAMQQR